MNHPVISTLLVTVFVVTFAGCMMASTTQEKASGEITGRVFSKSDVQTMEDRPIQVLVLAVPSAKFDSLLGDMGEPKTQAGEIVNVKGTVENAFTTYATGHDVSSKEGRYRIPVTESGAHYVCLTGETEVPETNSWTLAGCMEVEVSEDETVEQDLYMQFGSLVTPR